ncbi:MAG TPA: FliG C-terminal domain-containing protein [Bacteroidales bacterium]|nr:FliG C-terminal domain-containing protein [Bacteroidales bacterium]
MRSICLYFQVHQPFRLRTYRFFNIGDDHHYYDDYQNRQIIKRVAEKCYLPANKMMLDLIREYGTAFKVSFSVSGTALEQLQQYVPEVIQGFRQLAKTGCVEFLAETYSHSLASLGNREEFVRQVKRHSDTIEFLFGQKPQTFRNSELIYSDGIGEMAADMGFTTLITEGARHILGWKSPNYMYCSAKNPKLKLLLRNFRLSDDIAFRFSTQGWPEWPLTAEKFTGWLNGIQPREEVVNVFIDYETIGERQWKETGIFEFFKALPKVVLSKSNFRFSTPAELTHILQPVAQLHVAHPISWADEERDLTSWLGNELQDEAFSKLYALTERIQTLDDPAIERDWQYLQTSDHFYYMCTKWFSDGTVHKYFNPYPSPYEAFINYMNVLSDFTIRVEEAMARKSALGSKAKTKQQKETEKAPKAMRKAPRTTTGKLVEEGHVEKLATIKAAKARAENARKVAVKTTKEKKVEKVFKSLNFDDIITLSDSKIKKMIKNLEIETVSAAMKGANKELREKVEKNLGKRALKTYKELLHQIKTISESEIKKSRKLIEKQIKLLTK